MLAGRTGRRAPLSILAETGAISDATVWALRSDLQRLERALEDSEVEEPMSSRGQLRALLRYVTACGERGPVPGWTRLTDRDIYSDRSVLVRRPAAAAPVRSRGDDVVPFPAHRARPADEAIPFASRRLRAAENAPPVRRPRGGPRRDPRDHADHRPPRATTTSRPRSSPSPARAPATTARTRASVPAQVSRPQERAYDHDDEVVYSALDGPYGDVDWTG